MTYGIVIVGVGGQGTLLASKILGSLAVKANLDVKVSEVHGMSQRGGSVITYVRIGENVFSPMIEQGGADVILAFEELEALRALPYVKEGGAVVVNEQQIAPMPVITGTAKYPENPLAKAAEKAKVVSMPAGDIALSLGNVRVMNVVLMGALSNHLPFSHELWIEALKETVPERFLEVNLKAFEAGREYR